MRKHLMKGKKIVLVYRVVWSDEAAKYYIVKSCLDVWISKINKKEFCKNQQNVSSAKECDIFINFAIHCELVSVCPRQ